MKQLWAPWRVEYILSEKEKGCLFCRCLREQDDRKNLVLLRTPDCLCMFNRYPYNNGHLMIAPKTHCSRLNDLPEAEFVGLFRMAQQCEGLLSRWMRPEGFNVGFNLGKVAGAGIEDHLHIHIVPRWNGDTNFMTVLADSRVVPQALDELYDYLSSALKKEDQG